MRKVDDMSIEEMEGYFKRVDKIFHVFGNFYRVVWPFDVFSPFSPTRILLNFGVILTWLNVLLWGLTNQDSPEDLGQGLVELWASVLVLCLVVGLFERHYRIKIRYHQMKRAQRFGRMIPPIFGGQRPPDPQPQGQAQANQQPPNQSTEAKTGEVIYSSKEDSDLIDIGMGILKKIFR